MIETSGEWGEERLYVLQTIQDLKEDLRKQSEAAAIERANVIEKGVRDIRAAHIKIRALETTDSHLKMKNWVMTGALSATGAVIFELFKWALNIK